MKIKELFEEDKPEVVATLSRKKIYPTPGRTYLFAWKYQYEIKGLDRVLKGFDLLSTTIKMAKQHGATKIIKDWEK